MRYLEYDHVGPVLLAEPHVVHEELEHVEGILLPHVEQEDPCHEGQALAVAHLGGDVCYSGGALLCALRGCLAALVCEHVRACVCFAVSERLSVGV